jgi:uncharacterized protein (TIGR00369 family)
VKLPPYADLLGIVADPDGDGPVLLMPFTEELVGRPGFVHGGVIGGLLEMAALVALRHALGAGDASRIKPINVTVDYMRGGRDRLTRASGTVSRLGNRIANVEATAWQDDPARPIAAARLNYRIVRS